jgi:hypothetical protein
VSVLVRRRPPAAGTPPTRREQELSLQRRARRWLGTAAVTWPIWALTGAPTGLPHGTGSHHHLVITLGIWPAYVMVGGLADIARRARRIYVEPIEQMNSSELFGSG